MADGNYSSVRDVLWPRATDVVWLNYPAPLVLYRALARTLRRAVTRERLFAGNQESLRRSFFSRHSILLWVLRTLGHNRRRYAALQHEAQWRHLRFTELARPGHADRFLSRCAGSPAARGKPEADPARRKPAHPR